MEHSLDQFWEAICDEGLAAYELLIERDTPFVRRTFVRTVFAVIEGVTSYMKTTALSKIPADNLTPAETAMLREESFTLDNRGRVQVQPKFVPLDANLRFAFSMFGRAIDREIAVDASGSEWSQFKAAIAVRNRLVHPRWLDDLEVSLEEVLYAGSTLNWTMRVLCGALAGKVGELKERLERLEGSLEAV
jgi:hypothetical protein